MEGEQEWEGEESAPTLTLRTRKGKMVNLDAARVEWTAQTDRSVYLDRGEGIWKCRHCTWTYRMGSPGIDHAHNHEESFRGLANAKTLSQQGSCFGSQSQQGTASTDENGGTKFSTVGFSAGEKNQGNGEADLETKINGLSNEDNNGSPVDMRAENQLGFNVRYLETANFTSAIESTDKNVAMKFQTNGMYTREENPETDESDFAKKKFENLDGLPNVGNHKSPMNMKAESQLNSKFIYSKVYGENGTTGFEPFENVIRASSHGRLVHGSKPVVETDVERVLEEQDTHDLYCPNCNSCITKRVILRKRKRRGQDVQFESKREKIEPVLQPDLNASTDTGPDVFRCLACFSFFIPTASGFKLFRIFGRSDEGENLNNPQQIPSKNLNWISSIHEFLKTKKARNEPANSIIQRVEDDHPNLMGPSRHSEESLSHEMNDNDSSIQRAGLAEVISFNKEQVDNPELKPLEDEKSIPVSPKPGALLHGEIESDNEENLKGVPKTNIAGDINMQLVKEDIGQEPVNQPHYLDKITLNNCNTFTSPAPETSMVAKDQNGIGMHRKDELSKPQREGNNAFIPSIPGVSSPKGVQIDISKLEAAAKKTDLGMKWAFLKSVVHDFAIPGTATPAGPLSSQSNQTVPSSAAPGVLQDRETKIEIVQQKFDGARTHEWDILKSIVYGGLIESITSLGVVSSAAGSEAATLNIVALGLANLIGGLFVISHNLKELRNEQRSANDQNEQNLDQYQEILGRRENFWRHVVVAVFSYIIFGLIPPVIYGFSFRKTDNKEYKLIAVAAASLLCIALLAIGKAHVRKAPKTYIKTLLYYVGTGMLASGLSYVAGQLIKKLLEKLGWFDSGAANPMSVFVETRSMRSGWASY
ncbi:membrane protein of ER body-like protein isoform X11 [Magnolia sinica]|uniref:membrane protein of ER body-like protein isoform X11 n=1 Tax=Magnolia sinica TaxID=86752 RepID=UPI00265AD6DE|nr:membrane protein of ER body-like protein isoform X11 [Magnolia sinica]